MSAYIDLTIRIFAKQAECYRVELSVPGNEFPPGCLTTPLPLLSGHSPLEDGQRLFTWLLADATLNTAWVVLRSRWPQRRLRLRIDPAAPELHALPWELLCDAGNTGVPQFLAAASATPLSRYLEGGWAPGVPLSTLPVRMLVAIADPDFAASQWADVMPIDADKEWSTLHQALAGFQTQGLVELVRLPAPCTLGRLEEALKQGYHILHVIAHGQFSAKTGRAVLLMADAVNHVHLVYESDFAEMLDRQLTDMTTTESGRLRLVFLASCETATRSTADALRGFAPRLVQANIPAVLAMQDKVPVVTANAFQSVFYHQLLQHGLVDVACNEARAALLTGGFPGAAIPVLFSRLPLNQLLTFPPHDARPQIATRPFEPETILIAAGPFLMGRSPGAGIPESETDQHQVVLGDYRIGKFPITNRQYAEFLKRNKAQKEPQKAGWFLRQPPKPKVDHPVVGVNWQDAVAYCAWLSQETGRTYRLPSEAEWEKAASWAPATRSQRRYPWSDVWEEERCNVASPDTTPVDRFPAGASAYGCLDFLGNGQEWTNTIWGVSEANNDYPYPYRADDGRETVNNDQPGNRLLRVVRGGSFRSCQQAVRTTARTGVVQETRVTWIGFRIVMEVTNAKR